ncbi:ATP-binding cassette domain-containing protein [bacterium]|nr:ATP-binding cassette domain-containing protein [bacterium]
MALLEIKNLKVEFDTEAGVNHAVDGVSLSIEAGKTLGVVGESGCGKSVTAMSVLRLIPRPPGRIVGGEVLWKGRNLLAIPAKELPDVRGKQIAMVFQDPMTSLNPVYTVWRIFGEVLEKQFGLKGAAARRHAIEALTRVGMSEPETRLDQYPHELSGGMKQRVLIALALLGEPELLIADEPTTALDVTIQKQILVLLKEIQRQRDMAIMLITHSLGVVAETCDDVLVMYAGRVVEWCAVEQLFASPAHPYTEGLLGSIPRPGQTRETPLQTIEGTVPALFEVPKGCRFADRCPRSQERCRIDDPQLRLIAPGHRVACHFPLIEEDEQ